MPEPYPILNSLMLEQTGENRFRGPSVPSDFRPVVFGGQLMGQMIVAAAATLPDKNVKSLHAIFARAGTVKKPVDLDVDVMHAGRALASATVTARQGDRLLSRGLLLLDAGEPDLIRHSLPMPKVAGPAEAEARGWPDGGSEVRIVDGVDLMTTEVTGDPELNVWVKFDHAPQSQAVHQALLSWYTDPFLIAASMRPHPGIGQSMSHEVISTGVITHTLSFHEPVETYSTSEHLYRALGIPRDANGLLPTAARTRAGLGAEEVEDLGKHGPRSRQSIAKSSPEPAPARTSGPRRRRSRGGRANTDKAA